MLRMLRGEWKKLEEGGVLTGCAGGSWSFLS